MLDNNDVVPHRGVRRVCISGRNISFDSVRTNFFNVNELEVGPDSSRCQRALINIRRLCVVNVVDGLEYLLDGFMLPQLTTLLIQIQNPICPSTEFAHLLLQYIRRTIRSHLTLFSLGFCLSIISKKHL